MPVRRSAGTTASSSSSASSATVRHRTKPAGAPGLQFSMDWYDIDLSGAVGQLGQQRIVDECFAGAADLCALITRDPNTTLITNVRNVFLNVNKAKVRGIDYELLWNAEPDLFDGQDESFSFRLLAGLIRDGDQRTAAATAIRKLPETAWDKALAGATATALLDWC